MTSEQRGYLAYMLRLWQVSGDGEPIWRASLESPHTGERHSFASLKALFAFLEEEIRGAAPGQARLPETGVASEGGDQLYRKGAKSAKKP